MPDLQKVILQRLVTVLQRRRALEGLAKGAVFVVSFAWFSSIPPFSPINVIFLFCFSTALVFSSGAFRFSLLVV